MNVNRTYAVALVSAWWQTCGSVVRFYLVHKKIHVVNFFVNKIENLSLYRKNSPDMKYPGVPAFAGWMPAGEAVYCGERLIRLKPGLRSSGCLDYNRTVHQAVTGRHNRLKAARQRPDRYLGFTA